MATRRRAKKSTRCEFGFSKRTGKCRKQRVRKKKRGAAARPKGPVGSPLYKDIVAYARSARRFGCDSAERKAHEHKANEYLKGLFAHEARLSVSDLVRARRNAALTRTHEAVRKILRDSCLKNGKRLRTTRSTPSITDTPKVLPSSSSGAKSRTLLPPGNITDAEWQAAYADAEAYAAAMQAAAQTETAAAAAQVQAAAAQNAADAAKLEERRIKLQVANEKRQASRIRNAAERRQREVEQEVRRLDAERQAQQQAESKSWAAVREYRQQQAEAKQAEQRFATARKRLEAEREAQRERTAARHQQRQKERETAGQRPIDFNEDPYPEYPYPADPFTDRMPYKPTMRPLRRIVRPLPTRTDTNKDEEETG